MSDILADVKAAAEEVGMAPDLPIGIEAPEKVIETPEAPAGETAEQKADRERDEKGRFAKEGEGKPRETLKLKEKPAPDKQPVESAPIAAEGQAKPPVDGAKPADEPIAPPLEFKGLAKTQWGKLPKAIQSELAEHYQAVAADRAEFEPLSRAIAPHRDLLIRDAGSVEAGINELMAHYQLFLTNPPALIHHIARTRGIDLAALVQGQPQPGIQQQAPDITSHIAQAVQQAIAPIQERFAQTENQQIEQTLSAFAADPKHPYFQDVKVHMGQLLQAKAAKNLDDAYEQATWANPVIRQQLLQAQAEETAKTQATTAATARKAAAASLTGAPIAGAGAPDGRASKTESARETALRAYREQIGA
jgi:hypothetical protein